MIFYDFKKGLSRQESLVPLRETFGNKAPSEKTVYNWFVEFPRFGRASSVMNLMKEDQNRL